MRQSLWKVSRDYLCCWRLYLENLRCVVGCFPCRCHCVRGYRQFQQQYLASSIRIFSLSICSGDNKLLGKRFQIGIMRSNLNLTPSLLATSKLLIWISRFVCRIQVRQPQNLFQESDSLCNAIRRRRKIHNCNVPSFSTGSKPSAPKEYHLTIQSQVIHGFMRIHASCSRREEAPCRRHSIFSPHHLGQRRLLRLTSHSSLHTHTRARPCARPKVCF